MCDYESDKPINADGTVWRRFLPEDEYVQSFISTGRVIPPFLCCQPYLTRNGVVGYMVPCRPTHPDAEIWPV